MQALVLTQAGKDPVLTEFDDPQQQEDTSKLTVLVAGLNPVDRYMAANTQPQLPRVVGLEGIGQTDDGRRVYFDMPVAPHGSVAAYTLVKQPNTIELPADLPNDKALALGIAGLAGWLPLSFKAQLQRGESVLILGATGVQGQIAVQAAKLLGAGHVVAAGRDKQVLESLKSRGADEIVVLDGDMTAALKQAAPEDGYDVVVDSVFGAPFSAMLNSGMLSGSSRVVVLGGSAGQEVTLGFRQLQATRGAGISGYSNFFVPTDIKQAAYLEMAQHVLSGNLYVEAESFALAQAEAAWQKQASGPHVKIVVNIG